MACPRKRARRTRYDHLGGRRRMTSIFHLHVSTMPLIASSLALPSRLPSRILGFMVTDTLRPHSASAHPHSHYSSRLSSLCWPTTWPCRSRARGSSRPRGAWFQSSTACPRITSPPLISTRSFERCAIVRVAQQVEKLDTLANGYDGEGSGLLVFQRSAAHLQLNRQLQEPFHRPHVEPLTVQLLCAQQSVERRRRLFLCAQVAREW